MPPGYRHWPFGCRHQALSARQQGTADARGLCASGPTRITLRGRAAAETRTRTRLIETKKPLRYGPLEARRTGVIWVRPLAWPPRLTGVRQVAEFSALPVCILQARRLCGRLTYAPTGILARGQAGRAVVPQGSRRSVVIHSGGKARPAETGSTAVASAAATAVRGSSGSLAARPGPPGS